MLLRNYLVLPLIFLSTSVFAQRDTIPLNDNWLFSINTNQEAMVEPSFANAETVNLPHTWNVVKGTEMYYGWGYYQKKINIPSDWKNKNMVLQSCTANHTSFIYKNREKVGENWRQI